MGLTILGREIIAKDAPQPDPVEGFLRASLAVTSWLVFYHAA